MATFFYKHPLDAEIIQDDETLKTPSNTKTWQER